MSRAQAIETRIFVVGVPRSGTTLVQSLLAAHSMATSFTESHFFDRHFTHVRLLTRPILTKDPTARVREFLAENGEAALDAAQWFVARRRWLLRVKPFRPFSTHVVARQLIGVLDEVARRRSKSLWVEKTPKHLHYIPFLEEVCGRQAATRFVHVIRNGLDVVASLHHVSRNWERPYDLDSCVRRWNEDVRLSLSRVGRSSDLFVFYEDLTTRPEATLRQLLGGLGLQWEPRILEASPRMAELIVTEQETWKAGVGLGIRRSTTSNTALTPEQRAHATSLLHGDLYAQLFAKAAHWSGPPSPTPAPHELSGKATGTQDAC